MTIELDRDLYTDVKVLAAREGTTVREITTSALEHYLHTHQ